MSASAPPLVQNLSLAEKRVLLEQLIRRRAAATKTAPVSLGQRRLWFLSHLVHEGAVYHIPMSIRFDGELDCGALRDALAKIVERHEILRTAIATINGAPMQEIHGHLEVRLPVVDLTRLAATSGNRLERQLGNELFNRGFDLRRAPLWRATLVRLRERSHTLFLTFHHAIFDDGSGSLLGRELIAHYQARRRGTSSPLPPLPVQYADFARWQSQHLESGDLDASLAYWRAQLADLPTLELPTDRPRPRVQSFKGRRVEMLVSADQLETLRGHARRLGITVFMLLLAAYQVLLARFSGRQDIPVGSPVTGRNRSETESLIGYFVNMVVMRSDLSGHPSFSRLAERVRRVVSEALAHQTVPFEQLVEALQPTRDLSRNPLFQIAFVLLNSSAGDFELPGTRISGLELDYDFSKFDMTLSASTSSGGLLAFLEHNAELFDLSTAQRMTNGLVRILAAIAERPERRLGELSVLSSAERRQLLGEHGETTAPAFAPVHLQLERQATAKPAALALSWSGGTLGYRALDELAASLASHLVALGVGPEKVVGLCAEGLAERVVGALGILKTGACYLSLDPEHPPARLAQMLGDARACVVLSEERWLERLPGDGPQVVCLDRDHAKIAACPRLAARQADPAQLAYVIFTSGSTGRPKGVAVDHGALANLVAWHRRAFAVEPHDRASQLAGAAFDASVWELWPYLTCGASLHRPEREQRARPESLRDWLVREAVTIGFLATPMAELMLALDWPADTALRWLLTGGDALRPHPRPGLPFVLSNNYGPTENTVVACSGPVPPLTHSAHPPSIGRPIDNVELYLLDPWLEPAPAGVVAEIYVGGAGLARGYLFQPALTAAVFLPDSVSGRRGARLYRTGDLARRRPDGQLEFRGRIDDQVKVRGHRIETAEVERALATHPAVLQTVVATSEALSGERQLVAWWVSAQLPAPSTEQLRDHLLARLPDFMVPSAWVELEKLPLNASGKIDRPRLPAPDSRRPRLEVAFAEPSSEQEVRIAAVWCELLGVDQIGIHDNFFDLGGSSLLMVQVHRRLEHELGREIPILALFSHPNVCELARHLGGSPGAAADPLAGDTVELEQGKRRLLQRLPQPAELSGGQP